MSDTVTILDATLRTFQDQKKGADRAISQLDNQQLFARLGADTNTVASLMKHVGGNLHSRWSDFLTTDGEKPDRNRDGEFDADSDSAPAVRDAWERGWATLEATLRSLTAADLERTITIRDEPLAVTIALQRGLAHTAQHVGQIIMMAKVLTGSEWQPLSVPRPGDRH